MKVNPQDSIEAAKAVGARMREIDFVKVAKGVIKVANNNMSNTLRETLIKKGRDPRDFTLVAFGGAGALHASSIAKMLSIPKVVIPIRSSVFCAFGGTLLDARHDFYETMYVETNALDEDMAEKAFARMEKSGRQILKAEGFEKAVVQRFAEVRYVGQSYEIEVPIEGKLEREKLERDFEELHERLYGVRVDDNAMAIIVLHLRVLGVVEDNKMPQISSRKETVVKGARKIQLVDREETVTAIVVDGLKLSNGDKLSGPAVIEFPTTTVLIEPGMSMSVDQFGSIVMELQ